MNAEQPKYTMEHVKDACELAILLHSIPKGKRPLLLAAVEGFIRGVESQERLMSQKPSKARPAGERKKANGTEAGNLWEQVESDCLLKAKALLKSETVPTEATVKMVRSLVEAAVLIDDLDLRWKQHEHPAEPFEGI